MYILILIACLFFLPLPLMAASVRKGRYGYKAIFDSVVGLAMVMLLLFSIASVTGMPVGETMAKNMKSITEITTETSRLSNMLGISGMDPKEQIEALTKIYTYTINALPGTFIVWGTVISYFEYMILARITAKSRTPFPALTPLKDFSLPKESLLGWCVIYILGMATVMLKLSVGEILFVNIQLIFQLVFEIQGIAVLLYIFAVKKVHKAVPAALTAIMFLTSIGQLILTILGFLDLGLNIRKVLEQKTGIKK